MESMDGKRIAILATDGFEEDELLVPRDRLTEAGATVEVVSPDSGDITAWRFTDWSDPVSVDKTLDQALVQDYDALVLPGGQINPDKLRADDRAVTFVRDFHDSGKPLAAICHAGWLLIEADVLRGRKATSYHSIATDMRNAGAHWVNETVVNEHGIITSRNPDDLPAFCDTIAREVSAGAKYERQAA